MIAENVTTRIVPTSHFKNHIDGDNDRFINLLFCGFIMWLPTWPWESKVLDPNSKPWTIFCPRNCTWLLPLILYVLFWLILDQLAGNVTSVMEIADKMTNGYLPYLKIFLPPILCVRRRAELSVLCRSAKKPFAICGFMMLYMHFWNFFSMIAFFFSTWIYLWIVTSATTPCPKWIAKIVMASICALRVTADPSFLQFFHWPTFSTASFFCVFFRFISWLHDEYHQSMSLQTDDEKKDFRVIASWKFAKQRRRFFFCLFAVAAYITGWPHGISTRESIENAFFSQLTISDVYCKFDKSGKPECLVNVTFDKSSEYESERGCQDSYGWDFCGSLPHPCIPIEHHVKGQYLTKSQLHAR